MNIRFYFIIPMVIILMVMKQLKNPHKNQLLSKLSVFSCAKEALTVKVATTMKYRTCAHHSNKNRAADGPRHGK